MLFADVGALQRADRRRDSGPRTAGRRDRRRNPAPYLTLTTLVRITKNLPRIRRKKTEAVLKRLADGTYFSDGVARAIAERLLRERLLP